MFFCGIFFHRTQLVATYIDYTFKEIKTIFSDCPEQSVETDRV